MLQVVQVADLQSVYLEHSEKALKDFCDSLKDATAKHVVPSDEWERPQLGDMVMLTQVCLCTCQCIRGTA